MNRVYNSQREYSTGLSCPRSADLFHPVILAVVYFTYHGRNSESISPLSRPLLVSNGGQVSEGATAARCQGRFRGDQEGNKSLVKREREMNREEGQGGDGEGG